MDTLRNYKGATNVIHAVNIKEFKIKDCLVCDEPIDRRGLKKIEENGNIDYYVNNRDIVDNKIHGFFFICHRKCKAEWRGNIEKYTKKLKKKLKKI